MNARLPLDVPVVAQPNGFTCGPASLKAVLAFHGRRFSMARLRAACGTRSVGTDHAALVQGARAMGARVMARANGTLDELRRFTERGLPVIVGWWSMTPEEQHFDRRWDLETRQEKDRGHFSVCTGVDRTRVWLMDPQESDTADEPVGHVSMSRRDFLSVWYDTDTDAYRPVRRWYAVAHFGSSADGG